MDDFESAGIAQAITLWVLSAAILFFGVPRAIGGIAYTRMIKEGACIGSNRDNLEIWQMLFTGKLDGCQITHNAAVLQAQTLVVLAVIVIALFWATYQLVAYGPVGADEVLGGIGVVIVGAAVLAVAAIVVLVWAIFWAFIIMIGICAGIVATSNNK